MGKNDQFREPGQDLVEEDEVEILEVVSVEDNGTPLEAELAEGLEPRGAADDAHEPDEYVLDFDAPEAGVADVACAIGEDTERARDAGEPPTDDEEGDRHRLVRLRADYDNLRKRIDRERREFEIYANFALVGRLLPVLDNMERALAAAAEDAGDGALLEGLQMIHRQLTDELGNEGLRSIDALGRAFDPNLHDAVVTEPSTEFPPNTVLEELQKGYLFQDRVLRPAMVKVSTGTADFGEDA